MAVFFSQKTLDKEEISDISTLAMVRVASEGAAEVIAVLYVSK